MLKLLSIGVNAYPDAPLRGCVQDSHDIVDYVRDRFRLPPERIRQLLDHRGTALGIQAGMDWLRDGAVPYQDVLVLHYSGHGTQVRDASGDELDRLDEAWCPIDFHFARPETWVTDDLLDAFVGSLPEGVALLVISDACHSGTLLRTLVGSTPNRYGGGRCRLYPAATSEERERHFLAPARTGWRRLLGMLPPLHRLGSGRNMQSRAVLLAATKATQLAADALIAGAHRGAHTYALLHALSRQSDATYAQLTARMRHWIDGAGFGGPNGQTPMLQGHRPARRLPVFSPYPRP